MDESATSDQQISPQQQTQQGTPAGASVSDVVVALNNGNRNMSAMIGSVQGALSAITTALERVPVNHFHQTTLYPTRPTITAITNTNPGTLTIPGHTMIAGDTFFIRGISPGFNGTTAFSPPRSMVEINFRNLTVASVAVNGVITLGGALSDLSSASLFHPYSASLPGVAYPQLTRGVFTWSDNVQSVKVRLWGSGAAGGGSTWVQYAGAGAGGAYVEGIISRPVSGTTAYVIDDGMRGIPANTLTGALEAFYSGPTAFGTYTLTSGTAYTVPPVNQYGSTPVYTGDLICYGANNGQGATSANTGGDGGAGGVGAGTYVTFYAGGGQGGASPPTAIATTTPPIMLFNASFPTGANGAGGGGQGGNNGQDGLMPGAGGAPGQSDSSVTVGFQATSYNNPNYSATLASPSNPDGASREVGQSGAGASGLISVEWITDTWPTS